MAKILKFDQSKRKIKTHTKNPEPPVTKTKKYGEFDSWLEHQPTERFPQYKPNYNNGLDSISEND